MYNEETKNNFISSLKTPSMKTMFASLFKRSAAYEAELDKDILAFGVKECSNLLMLLGPKSIRHIGSLKSQFSKYVDWGQQTGIASKNYWLLVPEDEDFAKNAFSSRYVKDWNELAMIVDIGLSVSYDKYLVYLLYMGIMGENFVELSHLEDNDVDKVNKTITTARGVFRIEDPLLKVITANEYYKEKKTRDEDSKYFIKPFKTKHLEMKPIGYQHVSRVIGKLNNGINETNPTIMKLFTPMTIWRSGLFYSLYQIEQVKNALLGDDFSIVSKVYGNKNSYSSYLPDYELYKEIFWGRNVNIQD